MDEADFTAWAAGHQRQLLRTIVVRDNISWWRRRRDVLAEPTESAAVAYDSDVVMVVQRALARLTERQRAVVVLRHFDDLSEVAGRGHGLQDNGGR